MNLLISPELQTEAEDLALVSQSAAAVFKTPAGELVLAALWRMTKTHAGGWMPQDGDGLKAALWLAHEAGKAQMLSKLLEWIQEGSRPHVDE